MIRQKNFGCHQVPPSVTAFIACLVFFSCLLIAGINKIHDGVLHCSQRKRSRGLAIVVSEFPLNTGLTTEETKSPNHNAADLGWHFEYICCANLGWHFEYICCISTACFVLHNLLTNINECNRSVAFFQNNKPHLVVLQLRKVYVKI